MRIWSQSKHMIDRGNKLWCAGQDKFLYNLSLIAVLSFAENTIKFLGVQNFKHDEFSMFSRKTLHPTVNFFTKFLTDEIVFMKITTITRLSDWFEKNCNLGLFFFVLTGDKSTFSDWRTKAVIKVVLYNLFMTTTKRKPRIHQFKVLQNVF